MTLSRPTDFLATKTLIVRGGFLLIVCAFLLSNLVSLAEMHGVESRNHLLVGNALTSIELVSRLSRDLDQKRFLVGEHIFEKELSKMEEIEATIAKLDADFAAAARAYEPLAIFSGERRTWESLEEAVSAIQRPIERALALSRNDQDAEARAVMLALTDRFDDIGRTADVLLKLNRDQVDRILSEIHAEHREAMFSQAAIALSGTLLALLIGGWVTRALKQRDEQVKQASWSLEERNRELDAFAGRVAHDLRGPLTTISVSASKLGKRLPEDDGALLVLRHGVARMDNLIHDLLTLSRIDGQTPGTSSQAVSMAAAVEEELRPSVERAGGLLRVHVEPAELCCSDGLLRQVLWNLGENAVKYRREDVRLEIDIEGSVMGKSYQLVVTDNGSGMSPREARQAFEPFFRGQQAHSTPGTGLGLSIVKRIIDSFGGTVSVRSEAEKGTSFVISVPLWTA